MFNLTPEEIRDAVTHALREDVGDGDVTTLACIPPEATATARINSREPLVLAGLEFARAAFAITSPALQLTSHAADGDRLPPGACVLTISGPARPLLTAERVALNFIQHLSGIATLTRRFVDRIQDLPTRILDTRKTTPGWRRFEKYAVQCGGGTNHRAGLWDRILIKDNHLAALASEPPDPITAAVRRSRSLYPNLLVEVEADTPEQAGLAAAAGADIVLLDNMSTGQLRESIQAIAGRARTEASGGVNLDTVRDIALAGVDFISVGALTHSARSVDLGLDFA
jgi:nicotinate-nucleotide pyrophosphorylase (carboxylating)